MLGIYVLIAYAAIMIIATLVITKRERNLETFCVGNRNENWVKVALSIGATWIWAPALFTSVEKAYYNGWVGLFWFLVPNVLCLIIFIPFAKKIRAEMPEGITLSQYMGEKYESKGVRGVYLFEMGALAVLSTSVQLVAGSTILCSTSGIPYMAMTIILAAVGVSYSLFSGIKASMLTDNIQMVFMLAAVAIFTALAIGNTGGEAVAAGLTGITGEYTGLFNEAGIAVFLGFGLPTAIGLLSGPFGDQSFWQRAFAVEKKKIGRAFVLGAIVFGCVPLAMAILGFIGAGTGFEYSGSGALNFELIQAYLPAWCMVPFLFMILSGLLSTVDSNLCSVASLSMDNPEKRSFKKTHFFMFGMLVFGILIANIPGVTVTKLFMFYGTLRASTLLPTVMTLKGVKLEAKGVTSGVIAALVIGLPIFSYGNIIDNGIWKTAGSLTTVLLSGLVALAITKIASKKEAAA